MTKQARKILRELYREHQKYRKKDKSICAISITKEDLEKELSNPRTDISAGLEELSKDDFIVLLSSDRLELTEKAIKHMRRRRIIDIFGDIIDFILGIFP